MQKLDDIYMSSHKNKVILIPHKHIAIEWPSWALVKKYSSLMKYLKPCYKNRWTTLRKGETNNEHIHKRNGGLGLQQIPLWQAKIHLLYDFGTLPFCFYKVAKLLSLLPSQNMSFPSKRKTPKKMAYLPLFLSPKNVALSCLSQNRLANLPLFQMSKCQPS